MVNVQQGRLKCIECTNKRDELYDVSTYSTKFLKYDPFLHRIENIGHIQLKNNPIEVKVQGAFDAIDYHFH
jgi:hypothetical protein